MWGTTALFCLFQPPYLAHFQPSFFPYFLPFLACLRAFFFGLFFAFFFACFHPLQTVTIGPFPEVLFRIFSGSPRKFLGISYHSPGNVLGRSHSQTFIVDKLLWDYPISVPRWSWDYLGTIPKLGLSQSQAPVCHTVIENKLVWDGLWECPWDYPLFA